MLIDRSEHICSNGSQFIVRFLNLFDLFEEAKWRPATVNDIGLYGALFDPSAASGSVAFRLETLDVDPKRGSVAHGTDPAFVFRQHNHGIVADHIDLPRGDAGSFEGNLV